MHNTHVVVEYPEYDDEENEVVDPIVTINGKSVVRCRPAPPASTRTDWGLNDHVRFPAPLYVPRARAAGSMSLARATVS